MWPSQCVTGLQHLEQCGLIFGQILNHLLQSILLLTLHHGHWVGGREGGRERQRKEKKKKKKREREKWRLGGVDKLHVRVCVH